MLDFVLMIIIVLSAILALIQKDLLKTAILTGFFTSNISFNSCKKLNL